MESEALLRERILNALGITSTSIRLTPALRARLVPGHDANGALVLNWDLPTWAGVGAIRSSVDGTLRFAGAGSLA